MSFIETIKLAFGHNLINPHLPNKIPVRALHEIQMENRKDLGKFGLFDVATPNFSAYYPDVTAEDLSPKAEDFIMPTYRALSEVVVHKSWNPVDFGKKNVLKNSQNLLIGQSIYPNHEAVVGNELGAVAEVAWEDSYTVNGITVPAGINAKMKIDGKSNPKIARGILMDPPSVHSTSATVRFLYEKSHESLTEDEFWRQLGTYDKDGKLVRKIASKILNYNELSFVAHGADAFAQKIGSDGKIINPVYADIANNSAAVIAEKKKGSIFYYDFKTELVSNSAEGNDGEDTGEDSTILNHSNNNKPVQKMNRQFILALAAVMGIASKDVPEEENAALALLTDNVNTLKNAASQPSPDAVKLQAEVDRLKPFENEVVELKKLNATELLAFQTKVMDDARAEVQTIFNKLHPENPPADAADAIKNATDLAALGLLKTEYTKQLDAKFPMACKSCGSNEVSRASAEVGNPEGTPPATNENYMEKLMNNAQKPMSPVFTGTTEKK